MLGLNKAGEIERPLRGELQDELMRFEGRFSARLVAAFRPLSESEDATVRMRAARDVLGFMSSALDIAVGPAPEVDLLDMVTLVTLGRDAMTRRWSVAAYGHRARGVAGAFEASLDDISAVARGAIPAPIEAELRQVIEAWQRENPDQDEVAAVRLSAYAKYREGQGAASSGLFTLLRGAAQTADTAVLLGDRALYATQRLPYLVRLHTRLAGNELFADQARAIEERVERTMSRFLYRAFLAFSGVAFVSATLWLLARVAYGRLAGR
jgi:hypothetical protein